MKSMFKQALSLALILSIVASPVVAGEINTVDPETLAKLNDYNRAAREARIARHQHLTDVASSQFPQPSYMEDTIEMAAQDLGQRTFVALSPAAQKTAKLHAVPLTTRAWNAAGRFATSVKNTAANGCRTVNEAIFGKHFSERDAHEMSELLENNLYADPSKLTVAQQIAIARARGYQISNWQAAKFYAAAGAAKVAAAAKFAVTNPAWVASKAGWLALVGAAGYGVYKAYKWATAKPAPQQAPALPQSAPQVRPIRPAQPVRTSQPARPQVRRPSSSRASRISARSRSAKAAVRSQRLASIRAQVALKRGKQRTQRVNVHARFKAKPARRTARLA